MIRLLVFNMRKCWLILLLITLAGCRDRGHMIAKTDEKKGDKVNRLTEDDEDMNAAIQEAIRTFPLFMQAMQQPDSSLTDFAVKMKFANGDVNREHRWVSDLHMIGGQLFGVLKNDPLHAKGIESGDTLRVVRDDISDWMYLKKGKLQGGYTMKAKYNSMDEEKKKKFREALPFEIE